ncbi:putative RNA-directed DNA polymerase [Tanacetum coccineum]
MEDLLYVKDYYLPVFSTEKPKNKTDAEWTILHRQVCGYIRQWVDDYVLNHICMGIKFEDEIQGLWLLGTLPDTWETFRTSLSNSAPDGVITMELAKGSILNEEMRRKSQGSSSHSDVLVTERQGRSKSRGLSNRGNHRSSSSKGKYADKNKHKKDDDGDDSTEVNTTTDEFFVCSDYDMVNLAHDDSSWILDSGATCHVATRKEYFSSYTPGDFGVVRMGNTGLSRIAGIRDICLKFDTGMELVLHNVKHVPDIKLNIISTGLLDEDGYHNCSGNGLWKVTLGSLIVAKGKRESKLYMTHPKISKSIVNAIDNDDMTELWHKRLGHMSEKGMSILSKKNVLSGVHDINLKKCSHCLARKQTRRAFKSHPSFRTENILDLVHSDVCGPMKTKTLGGCSYFVTFIDDHSKGKVLVYTLKTKDQVLDVFKQFHALVERRTWKKTLTHQKTPPKTPQLNGLAERMNRTLVERVRCLLSHAGLPASFWGFGAAKNVSYHHLRVFGCKASVHIPKDERSKLDVKNKPCVFLGYEHGADDVDAQEQPNLDEDIEIPQHNEDPIDLDLQPNLDEDIDPKLPVPMPPFVPLRRSTRDHHPSTHYSANEYVLLTNGGEPECYAEALEDEHKKEWFDAMQDEMKSLYENNTFELTKLPKGKRALKNKWAASLDLEVEQMDVKTTFLHGDLDKEIYMEQPEGFQVKGKEDYRFGDDDFIILLLYVDDMMIVGKNIGRITQLKQDLSKSFAMKDCGTAKQILGIRIFHDRGAKKLHISQEQYIEKVLRRFNMDKAKVIEFHMYAIVCIRTNLAHAVGVVSRFLSNPGITFGNGKPMLVGYTNLDLAGNKDNMKSTSGYLMTFVGGAISWQSRLQKCVSLSTTEDEYVAATEACKELLWLKRTKHIDIRYHWIRDAIEDGMFELNKVHTDDNASDMLTKAVAREKLKICCSFAGMANSSS